MNWSLRTCDAVGDDAILTRDVVRLSMPLTDRRTTYLSRHCTLPAGDRFANLSWHQLTNLRTNRRPRSITIENDRRRPEAAMVYRRVACSPLSSDARAAFEPRKHSFEVLQRFGAPPTNEPRR